MPILVKTNSSKMETNVSSGAAPEVVSSVCPTRRLAYLVSRYPAVSHTFIFNEIRELRKQGFDIFTASINACDRLPSQLPELEKADQTATFYVKSAGWLKALHAVISSLANNPAGTLRGLLFTLRLGGSAKRFFYFIEALMIGKWMREKELEHLHVHFGMAASSVGMIAGR